MIISANEKRAMAFRQAGHALVGKLTARMDPIHKVTIIPHGHSLGVTQQLPTEDRLQMSEEAAHDQIAFRLGGRVAEQLVFGRLTTGSAHDIEAATALARRMVCEWGMSKQVGPLFLGQPDQQGFLGSTWGRRHHAEATSRAIDDEVRRLLLRNQERAWKIISENRDKLDVIAQALLELETIDGAEVDVLLAGGRITRPPLALNRHGVRAGDTAAGSERPALLPPPLPVPAKA